MRAGRRPCRSGCRTSPRGRAPRRGGRRTAAGGGATRLDALQLSEVLHAQERMSRELPVLWNAGGGEHFRAIPWGTDLSRGTRIDLERWIRWRVMKPAD